MILFFRRFWRRPLQGWDPPDDRVAGCQEEAPGESSRHPGRCLEITMLIISPGAEKLIFRQRVRRRLHDYPRRLAAVTHLAVHVPDGVH